MDKKKSCVVLYSGGMDSTVVLHHALETHERVTVLIFDYAQRHQIEISCAMDYISNLPNPQRERISFQLIDLTSLGRQLKSSLTDLAQKVPHMRDVIGDPQNSTYVPNRNMMFLSMAAAMAESTESDVIYYGAAQADDTSGFWDCTVEFRTLMNSILCLNRRNQITIEAPLINKSKKEIIEYGEELGVNFDRTYTCYEGDKSGACGYCPSCAARIAGWMAAGKVDPVKYNRDIPWRK